MVSAASEMRRNRSSSRHALAIASVITASILLVEVLGGIITNSLALLADAGHMGSDLGALALSLAALWIADRPPSARRTYGFQRAETLAALVNGLALVVIAGYILWEAWHRFIDPPEVKSGPMLAVAAVGLLANIVSATLLFGQHKRSLNVRSAYLHVLGDSLSSVGVIAAGVIMLTTDAFIADPIISVLIGAIIIASAFRIAWESLQVLLDATPQDLDIAEVQRAMLSVSDVTGIHDMHIRTITSGFVSMSAHVETSESPEQHHILLDLRRLLARRFGIDHVTLQLESPCLHDELETCCHVDTPEADGAGRSGKR